MGIDACLYVVRPSASARHLALHARSFCTLHHLFMVDLSEWSQGGASLHPVAFLVAMSAVSVPGKPTGLI